MASAVKEKLAAMRRERDHALDRAAKAEEKLAQFQSSMCENEVLLDDFNRKISILDGDLAEAETRTAELQDKLKITDAEAEELQHKARRTQTLSGNDTAKASAMTAKWRVASRRAEESEGMIEELENKARILEEDLDTCESREQECKEAVLANDEQLLQMTANTRSLEVQSNKASNTERTLERNVEAMERKLEAVKIRARTNLQEQARLEEELDIADEERDAVKEAYENVKADYDSTVAELGEF